MYSNPSPVPFVNVILVTALHISKADPISATEFNDIGITISLIPVSPANENLLIFVIPSCIINFSTDVLSANTLGFICFKVLGNCKVPFIPEHL